MNNKIISIILLLFIFSCKEMKVETVTEEVKKTDENTVVLTPAQFKNAGIVTGNLQSQIIGETLLLSGKIDVPPQNLVSLSMPLGGYVRRINVLPGEHVRKGQTLAILENQEYIQLQQDYLTTKARLNYATLDLKRQRDLNEGKANSDKVYQLAQADYSLQNATLQGLVKKMQMLGINPAKVSPSNITRSIAVPSPVNGFVQRIDVNTGKFVMPNEIIFDLVDPSDIHLALKVFEKDLSRLSIGQRVDAWTNTYPDLKYPANIVLITRSLDADRSAEVHCHFRQYDKSLVPGMFMNAEVKLGSMPLESLPEDAIVTFEGKQYVFVQTAERTYQMTEVQLGTRSGNYFQIKNFDALSGKPLVLKGAYTLLMALKNVSDE